MKLSSIIVPVLVTVGACASSSFPLPKRIIRWKQHSLRPLRRQPLPRRNRLDESPRDHNAAAARRTKAKTDAPKGCQEGHTNFQKNPRETQKEKNTQESSSQPSRHQDDDDAAMTKHHHKNPLNCLCFVTIMCIFYVNLTLNAMQRFVSTIFL